MQLSKVCSNQYSWNLETREEIHWFLLWPRLCCTSHGGCPVPREAAPALSTPCMEKMCCWNANYKIVNWKPFTCMYLNYIYISYQWHASAWQCCSHSQPGCPWWELGTSQISEWSSPRTFEVASSSRSPLGIWVELYSHSVMNDP